MYKVDTFKNILVTSSQGIVSSTDKYFHDLNLKTKGQAIISVYDTTNGKRILLARKNFVPVTYVPTKEEIAINELSEKVHISIEDFSESRIPLSIAKKARQFKVTPPYKIKSATIYVGIRDILTFYISSGFDSSLLRVFEWLTPDTVITIDNVIVLDGNNRVHKINGRSFRVIDD